MNFKKIIIMRKSITLLVLVLFVALQGAFAQLTIFGSVVDAETGSGIPGASVIVKGTIIGGVTNSSGTFAIMKVPSDATLQISYIGYKTVEIEVENQTRFSVTLEPDVQMLGEVVVTADGNQYQTVTTAMGIERDPTTLTYAVRQITGDELIRAGNQSIVEGLIGRIPGLHLGKKVDENGDLVTILYARGVTSVGGAIPVLFVLDGIPMPGEKNMSWLNMEDIESITVLPSANAAILYGSIGANGAIVITTKKR